MLQPSATERIDTNRHETSRDRGYTALESVQDGTDRYGTAPADTNVRRHGVEQGPEVDRSGSGLECCERAPSTRRQPDEWPKWKASAGSIRSWLRARLPDFSGLKASKIWLR